MIYLLSSSPKTVAETLAGLGKAYTIITKEDFAQFAQDYVAHEGDLGIVYDFGKIIPESLLQRLPMINIHFSLLPKYRGATPVEAAILAGETETGITIQKVVKEMDAGDVLFMRKVVIKPEWSAGELQHYMDSLVPLSLHIIFDEEPQKWNFSSQVGEPTFCYKALLSRENAELRFDELGAQEVVNRVRAFNPEPLAWTTILKKGEKTTMNILRAEVFPTIPLKSREIQFAKKTGLAVGTKDGAVMVKELVVAGSKPLVNGDIVSLKGTIELA